jgi:hypothetical protein
VWLIANYFFFSQQTLSCHHFRQWWRQRVPHLLGPCPMMDYQFPQSHISNEDVQEQLIAPLEKFIVGTADGDDAKVRKFSQSFTKLKFILLLTIELFSNVCIGPEKTLSSHDLKRMRLIFRFS